MKSLLLLWGRNINLNFQTMLMICRSNVMFNNTILNANFEHTLIRNCHVAVSLKSTKWEKAYVVDGLAMASP